MYNNVENTNEIHRDHVYWLREKLREFYDREIIVLSHHTPCMTGTSDPIHEQQDTPNLMAHGFSTDLLDIIAEFPRIRAWAYGHTHYNNRQCCIFEDSDGTESTGTILVSNQYGYHGEGKKQINYAYDSQFTI